MGIYLCEQKAESLKQGLCDSFPGEGEEGVAGFFRNKNIIHEQNHSIQLKLKAPCT